MNRNICLIITYQVMNEATRQAWIEFSRLLAKSGTRLVLLCTCPINGPLPFPSMHIPFFLRDYARFFPHARPEGGPLSAADWELLEADSLRTQGGYSAVEAIAGLYVCRQVMEKMLRTLDPGHVLTWDSTSPLAMIVQDICRKGGWPAQTIERGLLPETVMIESRGIQAFSDLRTHWLAQEMPESAYDEAAFERIREFYIARKPQKYDQPDFNGGGEQLRQEWGLGNRKTVVFLGQYDPCGFAPPDSLLRRWHSPVFRSTEDTLMNLCGPLRHHPETALIFKPHPLDGNAYTAAGEAGAKIVKDVNVHALIDLADVIVAQFTTLQFEAALYGKPVVLAARSAWWGRNATYEVHRREDLTAGVFAALRRRDWAAKSANARAFLVWLMDRFLIDFNAGSPARRTLADMAKYMTQVSVDSGGLSAVDTRWRLMEEALNELRFGRRTSAPPPPPPTEMIDRNPRVIELFGKRGRMSPVAA